MVKIIDNITYREQTEQTIVRIDNTFTFKLCNINFYFFIIFLTAYTYVHMYVNNVKNLFAHHPYVHRTTAGVYLCGIPYLRMYVCVFVVVLWQYYCCFCCFYCWLCWCCCYLPHRSFLTCAWCCYSSSFSTITFFVFVFAAAPVCMHV